MRRLLNPRRLLRLVQQAKSVRAGGGPRRIKLVHLGQPKGLIVPSSELVLEVEANDGSVRQLESAVPIPFFYAWSYRIARKLHLPMVSRLDPERLHLDVKVPRRKRDAGTPA